MVCYDHPMLMLLERCFFCCVILRPYSFLTVQHLTLCRHLDRGDYNHKMFSWICYNRQEYFLRDENIRGMIQNMALYHFQAAAGVGILWATLGVHSFEFFFIALVLYVIFHLYIRFCLGVDLEEEN